MSASLGNRKLLWYRISVAAAAVIAVILILILKHHNRAAPIETDAYARLTAEDDRPLPMLLDLGAGTCVPCKMMMPILEELQADCGERLRVQYIDVKKNPDASKLYNIQTIPTQIFLSAENKELFRHEGFFAKEDMLKKWLDFGVDLQSKTGQPKPAPGAPEPASGKC
ncbi:thioredoxin family protein, partial [Planctomycetota bacterium]